MSCVVLHVLSFASEVSTDPFNGSLAAISPDHHWMAFVESFKSSKIPGNCEQSLDKENRVDQIWLYNLETPHKFLLVPSSFNCDIPEKTIVSIERMQFSLDSKTLYFQTSAWVMSGALHAINIDGSNFRYIAPSNDFALVAEGRYTGDLVISQHRYYIPLGSFDEYWAYTPEGKYEGPIGPDFREFDYEEKVLKEDVKAHADPLP